MSLCPEFDKRAAMSDGEFCDYVFNGVEPGEQPMERDYDDLDHGTFLTTACGVCGSIAEECGSDEYGRPWVHSLSLESEKPE